MGKTPTGWFLHPSRVLGSVTPARQQPGPELRGHPPPCQVLTGLGPWPTGSCEEFMRGQHQAWESRGHPSRSGCGGARTII